MDILFLIKVIVLGIVEGVTEFLPISSTGHLIIVGDLLKFSEEQKGLIDVFDIVSQFAAILAVIWAYRVKFTGLASGILRRQPERQSVRFVLML
ncbi:MAG: undecaprenyl-diphosphatase, partial [Azoarcus sp.]|nr:undecaprenyl-diphosphatase [Azoarcus sp.]